MKKNLLYSAMALVMSLCAISCSQEEILSEDNGGKIATIQVNLGESQTRALPTTPTGYQLRCIMQVVDDSGTALIGDKTYRQIKPVESDNMTFTFTKPSTAYRTLFWADYVKTGGDIQTDNLYQTTDLKSVTYNFASDATTAEGLFNSTAADAFFGSALSDASSVILKRPFARINLRPATEVANDYEAYDKVEVSMTVPAGFNALTGEALTTPQTVTYDGNIADADKNVWFSLYAFAGTNNANLGKGNDINITLIDSEAVAEEKKVTVAGENVTTTENVHANVNVTPKADNTTDVTVTFPGDLDDPNKPKPVEPLAVGDFIYKDGTYGKSYNENAVAIVFATGAQGGDAIGNYSGKSGDIAGYAMAINETTRTNSKNSNVNFPTSDWTVVSDFSWETTDYKGISYTQNIITKLKDYVSPVYTTQFNTFKESNSIEGTNVSEWYIPTAHQLLEMFGKLLGNSVESTPTMTKDDAFAAAYTATGKHIFPNNNDRVAKGLIYMSSTVTTATGDAWGITVKGNLETSTELDFNISVVKAMSMNASFALRPVLTVFATE